MSDTAKVIDMKSGDEVDLDEVHVDTVHQAEALRIIDQFRDLVMRGQIVQIGIIGAFDNGHVATSWSPGNKVHQLISGTVTLQNRLFEKSN